MNLWIKVFLLVLPPSSLFLLLVHNKQQMEEPSVDIRVGVVEFRPSTDLARTLERVRTVASAASQKVCYHHSPRLNFPATYHFSRKKTVDEGDDGGR